MLEKVATKLNTKSLIAFAVAAVFALSASFAFLTPASEAGAASKFRTKTYNTKAECEQSRRHYSTQWSYVGPCDAIGQKFGNKIVTIGYSHMVYTYY